MIELGSVDAGVPDEDVATYAKEVERVTRVPLTSVKDGVDKLVSKPMPVPPPNVMRVIQVQRALTEIGFFPGGKADGICGYRTQSAIRLFQEYVRSVETRDGLPDGRFGAQTQVHLERWVAGKQRMLWAPTIDAWNAGNTVPGEYTDWLALLEKVKQQYLASPSRELSLVNAFASSSDTRKVADWDFSAAGNIHLVGIRRAELRGKFDDIFVLLIKGLVFKFQGTTEPGASDNPAGPPFLVPGQHNYHFGWHRSQYLALRPQSNGVLIVRAGSNRTIEESDLDKGLEPNATINIHWGGLGMTRDVNSWSEGCQTINGSVYINASGTLVNCTGFAATLSGEPTKNPSKTRGAYNVLLDLVNALGGDLPGNNVKYTLLPEADLALAPGLAQGLKDARKLAVQNA